MTDFPLLKKIIEEHSSFVLSTHVSPDADALGSELAFYLLLKNLGKKVFVVNHSATPYNLEFLDTGNVIDKFDEQKHPKVIEESEVFILLDLNHAGRIVRMEKTFRSYSGIKICIDHHHDPENSFDYIFGGTDYCATSEIIYDFIEKTKIVELDYLIAYQLYAGIMTDTGSFRFDRTTPRVHQLTSDLLSKGVDPTDMYEKIYNQFRYGRVKLLGEALESIKLDSTKQIAYMVITRGALERNNATEDDVDGFVNYCLTIQGVNVGILFFELKDGLKISFRSKGEITVNKLAAEFGGGGHINASGTRLFNVALDEMTEKVISAAQKYLN